jgi:putative ABC transport system substrate-binding protein
MWLGTVVFIVTVTWSILAGPPIIRAQLKEKMPRVGVLVPGVLPGRSLEAFKQGLHELGYIEGQTITLEVRWDEHNPKRWPELAAEVVRAHVALIVTGNLDAAFAAKQATSTLPIVMAAQGGIDPVEAGLIESLAHPGGNITGLTIMTPELTGKRLELLKEVVPGLSRVALLLEAEHAGRHTHLHDHQVAAHTAGLQLLPIEVRGPDEFAGGLQEAQQGHAQALIMVQSALFAAHRARLAELALASRLPTMSGETGYAKVGGLMNYGPNLQASWRRAATYVDRLLKGAKPADLPVERPTQFELAINLKTATALGITVPTSLLFQATEVIR